MSGLAKRKMPKRNPTILLIVGGMLMLLAAWVTQQVLYEKWSGQLADIAIGESIFNSYESAHSFFEVLLAMSPEKDRENIVYMSVCHYWKGLGSLETRVPSNYWHSAYLKDVWEQLPHQPDVSMEAIPKAWKSDWQTTLQVGGATAQSYDQELKKIMLEVEATKKGIARLEEDIERRKTLAQRGFWTLYILGTAAWIAGNALRLSQEEAKSPEEREGLPGQK